MNKVKRFSTIIVFLCISAMPAVGQESVAYSIVLGKQNSNVGRCAVNVGIDGVGDIDVVAAAPNYSVNFSIPASQNKNHLVRVRGVIKWGLPPNNAPACSVNGELYINQIIMDEWRPIKEKFAGTESLRCINLGFRRINEFIEGSPAAEKLFIRPGDFVSKKIFEACDELLAKPLRRNIGCDLMDGKVKSVCEEDFFSSTNPNVRLGFEAALYARMDGQEVKRGLWEAPAARLARTERQQKEDELRRLREEERQKIAKQREEREAWLKTPEGKKYLAEEESKRRKAELEQEAKERERRAELEKASREREAQARLKAENCTKASGMSVGAAEQMADAAKVSVSAIKLLRTESWGSRCTAIVDTSKGIRRCDSEVKVKDKDVWVHFRPFVDCM